VLLVTRRRRVPHRPRRSFSLVFGRFARVYAATYLHSTFGMPLLARKRCANKSIDVDSPVPVAETNRFGHATRSTREILGDPRLVTPRRRRCRSRSRRSSRERCETSGGALVWARYLANGAMARDDASRRRPSYALLADPVFSGRSANRRRQGPFSTERERERERERGGGEEEGDQSANQLERDIGNASCRTMTRVARPTGCARPLPWLSYK